jgi:hypothetical protein
MRPWRNTKPPIHEEVEIVQKILTAHDTAPSTNLIELLDRIVCAQVWRDRRSSDNNSYENFKEFGLDCIPQGLGINSAGAFSLVRFALLHKRHYAEYTELLEGCVRERGRPPVNLVGDDKWHVTVSTSRNSMDRILLTLKRDHPEDFAAVCNGNLTPRKAARRLGLLPTMERREFGACDFTAATSLPMKAQVELLVRLFKALGIDAQCALLSRVIEPSLEPGLARRWRERLSGPALKVTHD